MVSSFEDVLKRLWLMVVKRFWLIVVSVAVTSWTIVISRLVMARHNNFGTFDYDLGIHDQAIWGFANGEWFNTVRGMASLGHHATFAYFFLVPFEWLGGGPNLWNVMQVFAIASCAVPIFFLCLRRFASEWIAAVIALCWLLQPWLSWFAQETFHPEVMAMPFLFLGYYYLDPRTRTDAEVGLHREDVWGLVSLVFAMMWKEDIALAVAMLGVAFVFMGRRRIGRQLFIGGVVWFVVFGAWMVPLLAGGKATYGGIYGSLGESSFEVFKNSLLHPSDFFDRLSDNNMSLYIIRLFAPFAFLAYLSPVLLVAMVPQFFANILTTASFTFEPRFHYQAIPMVFIMLASIDAIWKMRETDWYQKFKVHHVLVGLLLLVSLYGARGWGILPGAEKYRTGPWPLVKSDTSGWEAAVKRVGPNDGVAAHYLAVPHLTHRKVVYTFPNPWVNSYYGISNEDLGDPTNVKWLIISEGGMNEQAQGALQQLVDSGEFGDKQVVNGIATYRRLKPAQ